MPSRRSVLGIAAAASERGALLRVGSSAAVRATLIAALALVALAATANEARPASLGDAALAQQIVPRAADFGGFSAQHPKTITATTDYGPPFCRAARGAPKPTAYASSQLLRYRPILTGTSYQGIGTAARLYATDADAAAAWERESAGGFANCLFASRVPLETYISDAKAVKATPIAAFGSRGGAGQLVEGYRLVSLGRIDTNANVTTSGYLDLMYVKRGRALVTISLQSFDRPPGLLDRLAVLDLVRQRLVASMGSA